MQPRKTYNSLVPQLFDGIPIKTDDPIDSTMRRKIQKLQEYLQNNPAKVPKVSRTAGQLHIHCHGSVGVWECWQGPLSGQSSMVAQRSTYPCAAALVEQQQSQLAPSTAAVSTETFLWHAAVRCAGLQASRRLMRRIKATLRKPGDNLGHVKVAVHTYAYLLAMSADENSSYGPTFFLKELLTGPDAVVGAPVFTTLIEYSRQNMYGTSAQEQL